MAERVAQRAVQLGRLRVAPQRLAAVGVVDRRGHADVVGPAALAEQRKPDGRRERRVVLVQHVPDLRLLDLVVPGGPHFDFAACRASRSRWRSTPCSRRQLAGDHVRLHRPGDARESSAPASPGRRPPSSRDRFGIAARSWRAEAGDGEQDDVVGHGQSGSDSESSSSVAYAGRLSRTSGCRNSYAFCAAVGAFVAVAAELDVHAAAVADLGQRVDDRREVAFRLRRTSGARGRRPACPRCGR